MTMTTIPPEVGQQAPDFRLKGPGGQFMSLADFTGHQNVVLVFYPLAFSPVCSHQLPDVNHRMNELRDLNAAVLGVSVDSHYANEAFARSLGIEFPLLSDFKREAMTAYGVLNDKSSVSRRATFVIDKQGRLIHKEVSADPSIVPSMDRVLDALRAASQT